MSGYLQRFQDFMVGTFPSVVFCDVTARIHAEAFVSYLRDDLSLASKTRSHYISGLRTIFLENVAELGVTADIFAKLRPKEEEVVHHCPFTPEQVRHLLALASKDEFLKPLIVAGLATGLRQGDVANLEWDFIDFGRGVVDLDCRKTGKPAWIPIFRVLRELLDSLPKTSKFVFPSSSSFMRRRAGTPSAIASRGL